MSFNLLLGNQVGGGHGKDAMTVVGAVDGAFAGNEINQELCHYSPSRQWFEPRGKRGG